MTRNFTRNDLIQYYYDELPAPKKIQVDEALKSNPQLRQELRELEELGQQLHEIAERPSPTSVDMILEYSRSFSGRLETSH